MKKSQYSALAVAGLLLCSAGVMAAESIVEIKPDGVVDEFREFLTSGSYKGTIGTYGEYVWFRDSDWEDGPRTPTGLPVNQGNRDYGWLTGYAQLFYETGQVHGLSLGLEGLVHLELWNDTSSRNGSETDHYRNDIEDWEGVYLPQIYLRWQPTEKTEVVAGRWEHGKFTHIDDVQSEGAYIRIREIENVELALGVVTKFAELDYDDAEDWDKASQDLSDDATYGEDSADYLLFGELVLTQGPIKTNPFVYWHEGYATVYGLDLDGSFDATETLELGTRGSLYYVNANDIEYRVDLPAGSQTNFSDAFCWVVAPYAGLETAAGDFEAQVGYAAFDGETDGAAQNKPPWLRDYIIDVLDQDRLYGAQDCEVLFAFAKWKYGRFWTHYAWGMYHNIDRGATADRGRVYENEVQLGYKITDALDVNLRLFDVDYDYLTSGLSRDYRKVELRARYRF